jgi:Coenzyme PQQ synthesis protein D (PqqD)
MAIENNHLQSITDQDGAAILDIEQGMITTLNSTGAFVWQRLRRGEKLDTIVANLAQETGEDVLAVERDVRDFVESLKQNRLFPY